MNTQLREGDLAPVARPPWWAHPLRRRAVLIAGGLAVVAAASFWLWYTTLCGSCTPPITCATPCVKPPPPKP